MEAAVDDPGLNERDLVDGFLYGFNSDLRDRLTDVFYTYSLSRRQEVPEKPSGQG